MTNPGNASQRAIEEILGEVEAGVLESARTVRANPTANDAWDALEEWAGRSNAPDGVGALYRVVLSEATDSALLEDLVGRALRFHEEWYPEDAPEVLEVLTRALSVPAVADTAFQRMTVLFTSRERWADLLRVYDTRIASTEDAAARLALLEEALQTARDFANDDDRTLHYLSRLAEADSGATDRADALEKALEKAGKWEELASVLTAKASRSTGGDADAARLRVAELKSTRLGDVAAGVELAAALVSSGASNRVDALRLLEAVAHDDAAAIGPRRVALRTVRAVRAEAGDDAGAIECLEREIALAPAEEQGRLALEAGELCMRSGDAKRAVDYFGAAFDRDPAAADVRARLRAASERVGDLESYAGRLETAAEAVGEPVAGQLRAEIASVRATSLGDTAGAIAAYERLLEAATTNDERRKLCRTLADLKRGAGMLEETLSLLEQEASLLQDGKERRDVLREVALLALEVGSTDRAIGAWRARVESDPTDREALDALVVLLERTERFAELVPALRRRVALAETRTEERRDLVAIARVQSGALADRDAAIATLVDIAHRFGEDAEIVDELSSAYEATGRYAELAELLVRSESREGSHLAVVRARLGDVYRDHVANVEGAVAAYERALDAAPGNEDARAGLAVLAEDATVGARAVASLAKSYATTDEWEPELALLPRRLEFAAEADERVNILTRAAQLAEQRAVAHVRALEFVSQAFVLAPSNLRLESEVERLGELAELPGRVVDALRQAAEACGDEPARRVALLSRASVLAEKGGDRPSALALALAAFETRPGDVALAGRIAALVDDKDTATTALGALAARAASPDADVALLETVASLERTAESAALVDTLRRIAARRPRDFDALVEARQVAAALAPDRGAEFAALVWERAAHALRSGEQASGRIDAGSAGYPALEFLLASLEAAGKVADAAKLASEASRVSRGERRVQLAHAAAAYAQRAGASDAELIERFRDVLAEEPTHAESANLLCDALLRQGRLAEVLQLRMAELAKATEPEARLAARLAIVELVNRIDRETSRVAVLRANLDERPGHPPSIEAIVELLMRERRPEELVDLLADQAVRIGPPDSAPMWRRVAKLSESELADRDRARRAYEALVEIEPSIEAYDALADIADARADIPAAARWLERRLSFTSGADAARVALRLAKALRTLGRRDRALTVLEEAFSSTPSDTGVREQLLDLHRAEGAHEDVARVAATAVAHETDGATKLALAREAAQLFFHELSRPVDAIPMLELAAGLAPDDRGLRLELADAYRRAGRNEDARAVLEKIVEEYGRRRTPERAQVHAELGRVLEDMGELPLAIAQLEQATQIAVTNAPMLLSLGRLASRAGDADRAEKTYRTLLVLVRRRAPDEHVDVGVGEVTFELSAIAEARGEADKAAELRVAATEAAATSDGEAIRFVDALVSRGAADAALAGISARIAARTGDASVEIERRHAEALEACGRAAEALDVRLESLGRFPHDARVRREARKAAVAAGAARRFIDKAAALASSLRRDEDASAVDALSLARAECLEKDVGEAREAAAIFEALVSSPSGDVARRARIGLARTLRAAGDTEAERAVQLKIRDDANASADERIESLYRIAEIDLAVPERRAEGLVTLQAAVEEDGRAIRAAQMLRKIAESGDLDADGFRSYEALARGSGDPMALLDYLLCRAERADATMVEVREAVERATALGQAGRAKSLLLGLAEQAASLAPADARAVFLSLASLDEKAGDVTAALQWLARAAEVSEADDARAIRLRIAQTASQEGGDALLALEAYNALLADAPDDATLHEGLVSLLIRERDTGAVEAALAAVETAAVGAAARNAIRLAVAEYFDSIEGGAPAAIDVLRRVVTDDATNAAASQALERIYEREGYDGERARLLEHRLDALLDAGPSDELADVATRAAELHGRVDADAAAGVLRRALAVMPDHRGLIQAMLACASGASDAREFVALRERLIVTEPLDHVVLVALQAYSEWEALEDEEGMMRALERGLDRLGDDDVLRPKLEMLIRRRGDDARLVDLLVRRLRATSEPLERRVLALEAAAVLREKLGDPSRAALVLESLAGDPFELGTFQEYVACLVAADRRPEAIAAVGRTLEEVGHQEDIRVTLLSLRSQLRREAGDLAFALADLEAIGEAHRERTFQPMTEVLVALRSAAQQDGDAGRERSIALRLVHVLESAGYAAEARDLLVDHVSRQPDDVEALEWLARVQRAAGDFDGLRATAEALVAHSTGEAKVEAALTFAEACEQTGRLERAREILEHVRATSDDRRLVERLRAIYLAMGEHREVAAMLVAEARGETGANRLACLLEAGRILLEIDPAAAIEPLAAAVAEKPDDLKLTVQLVDAYLGAGELASAGTLLETTIAAHPKRRTPELSMLQHRMGRYARAMGDRDLEQQWLVASLECDKNNADSAADLSTVAMELGDFETALNALRAITLSRNEGPISKAMAYLLQAKIAHQRGESRRALLWARKAREVDPTLGEVDTFLRELGENP